MIGRIFHVNYQGTMRSYEVVESVGRRGWYRCMCVSHDAHWTIFSAKQIRDGLEK